MKSLLWILLWAFSFPAMAATTKVQTLNCTTQENIPVVVEFSHAINPLAPFTNYEFGATLKVHSPRGLYERRDLRMTPLTTYDDPAMRGDGAGFDGGDVYLRLVPVVAQGEFSGKYLGQLFVNDLRVKAYFNFRDHAGRPGLTCVPSSEAAMLQWRSQSKARDSVAVFFRPEKTVVLVKETSRGRLSAFMDAVGAMTDYHAISIDKGVKIDCGRNSRETSCTFRFVPADSTKFGDKIVQGQVKLSGDPAFATSFASSRGDHFEIKSENGMWTFTASKAQNSGL